MLDIVGVGTNDCVLYPIVREDKDIICNSFPKTEFNIKQHSGNRLFFFVLKVAL